jgi:Zn-dependent protease
MQAMGNLPAGIVEASIWAIPIIIAITFHEAAHGFVARRFGDDTAWRLGRVTFNPVKHIDLFGTIILPAMLILLRAPFLFGYAKPVPVNFRNLRNPRRDMIWVAAAGPGINIALALISASLVHLTPLLPHVVAPWALLNLQNSILINLVLAVFNMIPLPPLDGGRVAVGILPKPLALRLAGVERYGMLILIGLIFLLPMLANGLGLRVNPLAWVLGPPVDFLYDLILNVTGLVP